MNSGVETAYVIKLRKMFIIMLPCDNLAQTWKRKPEGNTNMQTVRVFLRFIFYDMFLLKKMCAYVGHGGSHIRAQRLEGGGERPQV